jgi:hypothetical protein
LPAVTRLSEVKIFNAARLALSRAAGHSETMNEYLRSDQYIHVSRDCPMNIDMHPVDDLVEIALGEHRIGGATLRVIVDHPDACRRLADALHAARDRLVEHLHTKAGPDPALSQLDRRTTVPVSPWT